MAGGYSKSPLAYGDVKELLDKALDSPRGIKITLEKHGHAIQLRQRASKFRTMDRASSKTVYPEGHPMHGRSLTTFWPCASKRGGSATPFRLAPSRRPALASTSRPTSSSSSGSTNVSSPSRN
jgi:hypothetical protein